jgi:hypothetical protein
MNRFNSVLFLLFLFKVSLAQNYVISDSFNNSVASVWPKSVNLLKVFEPYTILTEIGINARTPNAIDLSAYLPRIGDQRKGSCCAAYSTSWVMHSIVTNILYSNSSKKPDFYSQYKNYIFNPVITYAQTIRNTQKTCGAPVSLAQCILAITKNRGVRLSEYDIDDNSDPCICNIDWRRLDSLERLDDKFLSFRTISNFTDASFIKELMSGHPIGFEFKLPNNFYEFGLNKNWDYIFKPKMHTYGNAVHAAVIVGYDAVNRKYKVANSYGKDWGDNGFFYLSFNFWNDVFQNVSGLNQNVFGGYFVFETTNDRILDLFHTANSLDIDPNSLNPFPQSSQNNITFAEFSKKSTDDLNIAIANIDIDRGSARISIIDKKMRTKKPHMKKHRNRHRTNTTRNRCYIRCLFGNSIKIDITGNSITSWVGLIIHSRNSNVNHNGIIFYHFGFQIIGNTKCGDNNIGLCGYLSNIFSITVG